MISANERGREYVEEQAHGGADDRGSEAVGGRNVVGETKRPKKDEIEKSTW
jgi:hypothetical protein